ncbi:hypothetical protein HDV00_010096 [Rhizophlyctis rosea]|nr:hypothetical protein HDV00_010096 [Rhizophlyctis rosea]
MSANPPPRKPGPSKNDSGGIHRMVWSDVSFDKNGKPAMVESYYLLDSQGNVAGFGSAKPSNRIGNSNARRKDDDARSSAALPTPQISGSSGPSTSRQHSQPSRSPSEAPQRARSVVSDTRSDSYRYQPAQDRHTDQSYRRSTHDVLPSDSHHYTSTSTSSRSSSRYNNPAPSLRYHPYQPQHQAQPKRSLSPLFSSEPQQRALPPITSLGLRDTTTTPTDRYHHSPPHDRSYIDSSYRDTSPNPLPPPPPPPRSPPFRRSLPRQGSYTYDQAPQTPLLGNDIPVGGGMSLTHLQRQLGDIKSRTRDLEDELRSLRGTADRLETDILIALGRRGV